MAAAVLALVGLLISVYLWLWKIGVLGELVCFDAGCETVQLSEYAYFLGIPVAFLGLLGYLAILLVSVVGVQPGWVERREPTLALIGLSGLGVAYSAYLTYLEAAVIHAWCQWCVISAVLICLTFIAAVAGLWEVPRQAASGD